MDVDKNININANIENSQKRIEKVQITWEKLSSKRRRKRIRKKKIFQTTMRKRIFTLSNFHCMNECFHFTAKIKQKKTYMLNEYIQNRDKT
jgi:hypothetical protein